MKHHFLWWEWCFVHRPTAPFWKPVLESSIVGGNGTMFRESGIVKWFSRLKGYGFINPDEGGQEVFVHYSAIDGDGYKNLYEGDKVEYDRIDQGKGPQAKRVIHKR
jgi:CspA family cold shock protein